MSGLNINKKSTTAAGQSGSDNPQQAAPTGSQSFYSNSVGIANPVQVSGSQKLNELYTEFEKEVKNMATERLSGGSIRLIRMTGPQKYPTLLLCYTNPSDSQVYVHPLVVESSREDYPEAVTKTINGREYRFLCTPGDGFDKEFGEWIIDQLTGVFNVSRKEVTVLAGVLIPAEFDFSATDKVKALFSNSVSATYCEWVQSQVSGGITAAQILSEGSHTVSNIDILPADNQVTDLVGLPVRADICVTYARVSGNRRTREQGHSIHGKRDREVILQSYGYVDFVDLGRPDPRTEAGLLPSQRFIPHFVCTAIHVSPQIAPSVDIFALSAFSVCSVQEDFRWLPAFRPMGGSNRGINPRDIGVLNIRGNVAGNSNGVDAPIPTKGKDFTDEDLFNIAQSLIRPGMMISYDVSSASPLSWVTNTLNDAMQGGAIGVGASRRIHNAINNLSGGLWSPAADGGYPPIFMPSSNLIHGGSFRLNGTLHDLRHLANYTAVASWVAETNSSPSVLDEYNETMFNLNLSPEARAANRLNLLNHMASGGFTHHMVKYFHHRLTCDSRFISGLVRCLNDAKLSPSNDGESAVSPFRIGTQGVNLTSAFIDPNLRVTAQSNFNSNFSIQGMNRYYR